MKRRHNLLLWAGFLLVLLGVFTYEPIFILFDSTRDVPWVNGLLSLAGGCLLAIGLKRAFGQPELYRGKVLGSIFGALSLLLVGFACYGLFYASRAVPTSANALRVGQTAPDFTLASASGSQVTLSELLKNNRAVLLIFYRGYW